MNKKSYKFIKIDCFPFIGKYKVKSIISYAFLAVFCTFASKM